MGVPMRQIFSLLAEFRRDERGVFAILFALMAVVMIALSGAVVDYVSLEQTRNRSQIALDAAALALQPEILDASVTKADIQKRAQDLVDNRVGATGIVTIDTTTIDTEAGSLFFSATMKVNTAFVALVGVPSLSARIESEVTRGSMDVEVAVAVDITGSMNDTVPKAGSGWQTETKIAALERALGELIDLVVKDEQTPSYSKMAIVPYSMGVNVGSTYAPTIRGAVKAPTAITGLGWSVGSEKTITAATKANPIKITATAHGFANGDFVYINNVSGMTQLNNKIYEVTGRTTNTFQLKGVNGTSGYSTHSGSTGRVTKCQVKTCELVVTSPNHGLSADMQAHIYGAGGMYSYPTTPNTWEAYYYNSYVQPAANDTTYNWVNNNRMTYVWPNNYASLEYKFLVWDIGDTTQNTFVLEHTPRTNGKDYGTYTGGGFAACVTEGCDYYLYRNYYSNPNSNWRIQQISTCATERAVNGLTDVPAATTLIGRNYHSVPNPCPSVVIQPLTSDKTVLHALADDLPATGSTAGHLGIGWGWYMVSPNFKGPWPAASQPAPKTEKNVLRAVVLMTDGAFNTSYCNGVISQISGSGSGYEETKINCDPANGNSFDQAKKLCDAMKASDPPIRIYTVAFDVGDIQAAKDIMADCATDPSYAFEATTGADLSTAFESIGKNLAYLRITK